MGLLLLACRDMNALPDVGFAVESLVTFKSVHGDFEIDGLVAEVLEIKPLTSPEIFPGSVAVRIQFVANQHETWCRRDELTVLPESSTDYVYWRKYWTSEGPTDRFE